MSHLTTPEAIKVIDLSAQRYSVARGRVSYLLSAYQIELAALQKKHFGKIREASLDAADLKNQLAETIGHYPELFESPRTMTLHGIKVGFQKGKGKIEWEDDEKLADRILKLALENKRVLSAAVRVDKPLALRFAKSVSVELTGHQK